jgi:hypothetical protein
MVEPQQHQAVVPHRTVSVSNVLSYTKQMKVVTLVDRRVDPSPPPQEWLFQTDLEDLLYPATDGTNGAFYRLLNRSEAGRGKALSLRHASVAAGLLTPSEFDALKALLHSQVRVFTLVPLEAVGMALATYGCTPASEALLNALGQPRPMDWPVLPAEDEDDEEGDGEEEEEDGGEEDGDEDEREDGHDGDGPGGGGHGGGAAGSSSGSRRSRSDGEDDECPTTEEEAEHTVIDNDEDEEGEQAAPADAGGKRKRVSFKVAPSLAKQLAAFQRFRTNEISCQRDGKKVAPVTAADDERRIVAFFSYLETERGVEVSSLGVFSSPKIGAVTQEYIRFKTMACEYAYVAKTVGSLIAAARFVLTIRKARAGADAVVSTTPLDELTALHKQCLSEGRQCSKFSTAKPPKAWLDWAGCQRARLSAENALIGYSGASVVMKLELTRDACLLKLLTAMPPDRVGVFRLLKLGGSLKQVDGSFQIDLSEPGAHKTSAIFGPTCTTVTASVAERISQLIEADNLITNEFLFHEADRLAPLAPSAWTRLVKATFKDHSGVALCPKDCRSSFITWLKDGDHGDEACRSAAKAMRHSSTVADSAAYDKHKSDRVVEAAMKVADAFAKQFVLE